jgi:SAM-dependent methyltransferase
MGERYDSLIGSKVDALIWRNFVLDYTREKLERAARDGARRYLDFACGTGRILEIGHNIFPEAVGLDLSEDMLEVARRKMPRVTFYCVDITRHPDSLDGKFDCVSIFRFLLNAEEPLRRDALAWIAAHMNPGSLLIGNIHMYTYSLGGIATAAARFSGKREINHVSRRHIAKLLAGAGFRIDDWAGFRVLPTIGGQAPFGNEIQLRAERFCNRIGFGRFGSEHVFTARRC